MAEERRPLDGYQEFVEPRQLTLDRQDLGDIHPHSREERQLLPRERDGDVMAAQDPLARPYADLESTGYPSPGPLPDALDLGPRGGDRSPFLWSGDYGPSMMDPGPEFPPFPFDDWSARIDERQNLVYDTPALPSLGFPPPFPGPSEFLHPLGLHPPGPTLPPLHSFAPLSPFPYDANSMDMLHSPSRGFHAGYPELDGGSQLPLLPSLGTYLHGYDERHILQEPPPPPPEASSKKTRVDKRNTKPLTVEDLVHDNSRFAKVVKAFLSIEDQENRTVPEIAKRVSEMYAGQYADFEGVKRMVNDVLQKHKAFWHPGRGSPYQLNLNEGRARREFPSNSRRLVRNRYDENLFYPRGKKHKKSRQPAKRAEDDRPAESCGPSLLQSGLPREDEGDHGPMSGTIELMDRIDNLVIDPCLLNDHGGHDRDEPYRATIPPGPRDLQNPELDTLAQTDT